MAPTLTVPTPDGRALDVWLAGPADGQPVLFHHGTPGSARPNLGWSGGGPHALACWGWFDDDMAFTRPWGCELRSIPGRVHLWQGGHDRMVPFAHGGWLAANVGGACPHLSPDGGHLSLVVERFGAILDELIAGAA